MGRRMSASSIITTNNDPAAVDLLPPVTPGEILREEYMLPLALSANRLAEALGVPANRITAILNGTRAITADTATRLALCFNTTPGFWLNLQNLHDLELVKRQSGAAIAEAVRPITTTTSGREGGAGRR
jgi:addiction module HigA family antidote